MALSKERKVLLGLLGSAGLILGVDQLFLGPPTTASASTAPPTPTTMTDSTSAATATADPSSPTDTAVASSQTTPTTESWNDKLEQASSIAEPSGELLDPFSDSTQTRSTSPDTMTAARFAAEHSLSAVVTSGDVGVAMVNGRAVRVGDEVAGYRLTRVDTRSAEFRFGEDIVRLELPLQGRDGP